MPPTPEDRLRGAVLGALVADAYCLGSHWIYDREKFETTFPAGPAGFDVPAEGHYHAGKAAGDLTHYGEGCRILLATLADGRRFDHRTYGTALVDFYSGDGKASYRDRPTKKLLADVQEAGGTGAYGFDKGSDDDQNVTTSRLAPLVARHAGDPELMLHVDAATRVLQDNDRAVAYACAHAQLLTDLFAGAAPGEAFTSLARKVDRRTPMGQEIAGFIDAANERLDRSVLDVTSEFGLSCPLVKAFPAAIHNTLRHADNFEDAIKAGADAAGDNASRIMLVGSWLGAAHGASFIPEAWLATLNDRAKIERDLASVIAARPSAPGGRLH